MRWGALRITGLLYGQTPPNNSPGTVNLHDDEYARLILVLHGIENSIGSDSIANPKTNKQPTRHQTQINRA